MGQFCVAVYPPDGSILEYQNQALVSKTKVSTAEAFYLVFCALPKKDRIAVARYILQNDEIRKDIAPLEIPNGITLKAFDEDKAGMPGFASIDELRQDLVS